MAQAGKKESETRLAKALMTGLKRRGTDHHDVSTSQTPPPRHTRLIKTLTDLLGQSWTRELEGWGRKGKSCSKAVAF